MTDREKAIIMAYTGVCMLAGDKLSIFYKYVGEIMGRPIWTHEMGIGSIADEIKEKSKGDFIALCADESRSENPNKWMAADVLNHWIGAEVLDKIRAEIQSLRNCSCSNSDGIIDDVEDIIDKYKAENGG